MKLSDKLKQIDDEWEKDSVIQPDNLGQESLNIPYLHNKYYKHLLVLKNVYRREQENYVKMKNLKHNYYNGTLTKEELDEHGWEQYQEIVSAKKMENLLSIDPDVTRIGNRVALIEDYIVRVQEILKIISTRSYHINNAIDWEKISSGII